MALQRKRETTRSDAGRWLLVALVMVVGFALACAISPLGRRQLKLYPDATIDSMGVQSFDNIKQERPVSQDASASAYVQCVADALIAELDPSWRTGWEVVVFEDPTANAFALPGRKIGVHTGLLNIAATQDQLAAVVGHEIGHVLASHGNERVSQQYAAQAGMKAVSAMTDPTTRTGQNTMAALGIGAQYGVLLPFSRTHESEADEIGIDLMAKAGFDPAESVALWRRMASASSGQQVPEWASTHPAHSTRIANLEALVPAATATRDAALAAGRAPRCR